MDASASAGAVTWFSFGSFIVVPQKKIALNGIYMELQEILVYTSMTYMCEHLYIYYIIYMIFVMI